MPTDSVPHNFEWLEWYLVTHYPRAYVPAMAFRRIVVPYNTVKKHDCACKANFAEYAARFESDAAWEDFKSDLPHLIDDDDDAILEGI